MKQHTIIGAKILEGSDSEFIDLGEPIALSQHEKWDGSGYPNGLKGKDIPLAGRLAAIADVFDALTSAGRTKNLFLLKKSLMSSGDGGKPPFDPDIVDAFLPYSRSYRNQK